MELIERYLQAVKFWLPETQKEDIAAELSEDIDAQIAEREVALGRPLETAEVEAILKKMGRPVIVANRYLPQKQLIGPMLYPVYAFVLKIAAACVLAPQILAWIGMVIYVPGFGEAHNFGSLVGNCWTALFITAGVVTLVFAVLERMDAKTPFMEAWEPKTLPPVRDPLVIPRSEAVLEFAGNLSLLMLWTALYPHVVTFFPGLKIYLAPSWTYAYWGFLAVALATTALSAFNLSRRRTAGRLWMRLMLDMLGGALFCWLMGAHILTRFATENMTAQQSIDTAIAINGWSAKMVPVAIAVSLAVVLGDAFRIWKLNRRPGAMASPAALAI